MKIFQFFSNESIGYHGRGIASVTLHLYLNDHAVLYVSKQSQRHTTQLPIYKTISSLSLQVLDGVSRTIEPFVFPAFQTISECSLLNSCHH